MGRKMGRKVVVEVHGVEGEGEEEVFNYE